MSEASAKAFITDPAGSTSAADVRDAIGTIYTDLSGGGGAFGSALLHVRDEKASTTDGGTFTSGAWQTRDLNTVKTNEISGASLASNQITLPAGTYWAEWACPAYRVARHQSRLYNTTDTAVVLLATSEFSDSAGGAGGGSTKGSGRFTLAAEKVLEVQHRCQTTFNTLGLGIACSFTTEVYTDTRIWKIA